jgi:hypothetical protein
MIYLKVYQSQDEELAAAAATNKESTNNEEDEAIDKTFCSCGHCVLLPKQRECLDKLNTNIFYVCLQLSDKSFK